MAISTIIIQALVAFCMTLPYVKSLEARIAQNAAVVAAVVESEGPLPLPGTTEEQKIETGKLLLMMGYFESLWLSNPPGYNDRGLACGVMQVHTNDPTRCKELRSSLDAGYRAGLRLLKVDLKVCGGNVHSAIGAFASGSCGGAGQLVSYRMGFIRRAR